eukprot:TRINITY_DN542_c0_g3_i1.p1 TRINITY_DN542_c0_g3~~TRINITY_DN542_c0_g3_i1.p1  ORF type:complete len:398 (-),score=114.04 TRINITY_DN542_c0_g3_i1:746-1858(-)
MESRDCEDVVHLVVLSIPLSFQSTELRHHFSSAIEENVFQTFHYTHRTSKDGSYGVCPVSVTRGKVNRFINRFHGSTWIYKGQSTVPRKVRIEVWGEMKEEDREREGLLYGGMGERGTGLSKFLLQASEKDDWWSSFPEFCTPRAFPKGNVGTPMADILAAVNACKVSSREMKQLGFSKMESVRAGNAFEVMPFDYERDRVSDDEDDDEDDDGLLEYEDSMERDRDRVYEEDVEKTWEKGGSGLVFHTDERYWSTERCCGSGDASEYICDEVSHRLPSSSSSSLRLCSEQSGLKLRSFPSTSMVVDRSQKRRKTCQIDESDSRMISTPGLSGHDMMERMGWKGGGLGVDECGRKDPIIPTPWDNKRGIGH